MVWDDSGVIFMVGEKINNLLYYCFVIFFMSVEISERWRRWKKKTKKLKERRERNI